MTNNADEILELLLNLCSIPSVTGIPGAENNVPEFLHEKIRQWHYFQRNPKNIWFENLRDDHLKRVNFCAMVRATPATKRTVILISHHDVVTTDMCGHLHNVAFTPNEYGDALRQVSLNDEAQSDLDSREWLFGRGVSDMKSGMAVQIGFLAEAASHPDKLKANIMLMTLADEENNGFGVHQAVRMLVEMQEKEELEYIACIDSEPTITNEDKNRGRIYTGSIGNTTPFALCIGRESHVGEYFHGINAALTASYLVQELEGAPKTSDSWNGKHYSPAACLKLKNINKGYFVTLPERVAVVFNALTVSTTPAQWMKMLAKAAQKSLDSAMSLLYRRRDALRKAGYAGLPTDTCIPYVIRYEDLLKEVSRRVAVPVEKLQTDFIEKLDPHMDSQERGIELTNYLLDISGLKGPLVVIGLLSPYCQPRINRRRTKKELAVIDAVEKVISTAKERFGTVIEHNEVYEGISDMSEMGFQGDKSEIDTLVKNLIGWGSDLKHPFREMQWLDIPVVNLGPIGKDAHKLTERVHIPFLLDVLPELFRTLVQSIAEYK